MYIFKTLIFGKTSINEKRKNAIKKNKKDSMDVITIEIFQKEKMKREENIEETA